MIKQHTQTLLTAALIRIGHALEKPLLIESPKNRDYGDLATNVAFMLTKKLKKSPKLIAEELCGQLNQDQLVSLDMEFIPINGFINVKFKDSYLIQLFEKIHEKPQFPECEQKILLEYVSANPTGPLHIGHGRWAVMGHVIDALLKFVGIKVATEFYINDAGNQIENFYKSVAAAKNNEPIPEDGYHGAYINDLLQADDPVNEVLTWQQKTLGMIGVTFDNWFSERTLHNSGKVQETISELREKELVYEEDGALWFKSSEFGDEKDRVLIKADGNFTYFAVDVAYHRNKLLRDYDQIINIWGADHHGYIARMRAALMAFGGDKFKSDDHFLVLLGQLVSLYRNGEPVRMSKRTGDMISLEEVIEEIGADACRYFLVEKSADTKLDFDLEVAKKKSSENPVFYIQYAHARICSMLNKLDTGIQAHYHGGDLHPKERELILFSLTAYDEIYQAATSYSPHKFVQYLWQLARQFHLFYEACPLLKATDVDQQKRVLIIKQVRTLLSMCLDILAISAPEVM